MYNPNIIPLIAKILKKWESQLAWLLMLGIKIHLENYEILGKSASQAANYAQFGHALFPGFPPFRSSIRNLKS